MPSSTTPHGLPYMLDLDPLADVAATMEALAQAVNDKIGRQGSASLDFPTIPAGGNAVLNIPVAGAEPGDLCSAYWNTGFASGVVLDAYCNNAGQVAVRASNITAAAIDPGPFLIRVTARRY